MQPSKRRTNVVLSLEEELDVDFTILGIDPSRKLTWSASFRPEMTQDIMPDIYTTYRDAIADSTISASAPFTIDEISRYMPTYTKELRRYFASADIDFSEFIDANAHDGNLYYIPRLLPMIEHPPAIVWRKDILDDIGLSVPVTIEEWELTFERFKERYPDSFAFVFRDGFYWLGDHLLYISYGGVNTRHFEYCDGSIRPTSFRPEYIDAVETMRRWYSKGYIRHYTAAEIRENKTPVDMFIAGDLLFTVSAQAYGGNWYCEEPYVPGSLQDRCNKQNPDAYFELGRYPVVDDEITPTYAPSQAFKTMVIGFGAQLGEDRDRLHLTMQLLDTMGSDLEVFVTAHAGIEGVDWEWHTESTGRKYVGPTKKNKNNWDWSYRHFITYWGLTSTKENRELLYDSRILESIEKYTGHSQSIYGDDHLHAMENHPTIISAFVEEAESFLEATVQLKRKVYEEAMRYVTTGRGSATDVYEYQLMLWNAPYAREFLDKAAEWYRNGDFF